MYVCMYVCMYQWTTGWGGSGWCVVFWGVVVCFNTNIFDANITDMFNALLHKYLSFPLKNTLLISYTRLKQLKMDLKN